MQKHVRLSNLVLILLIVVFTQCKSDEESVAPLTNVYADYGDVTFWTSSDPGCGRTITVKVGTKEEKIGVFFELRPEDCKTTTLNASFRLKYGDYTYAVIDCQDDEAKAFTVDVDCRLIHILF